MALVQPRTVLEKVREQLKSLGKSEFAAVGENPSLQALFDQRQALKVEMNAAKKAAMAEAAKPYEEALDRIEKQYAMYIKLSVK
jgi:dynactin complex subunit